MKNIISIFAVSVVLSGCALTETPVAQQESLHKPSFDVRHQEDRITFLFNASESGLSSEDRAKAQRFVNYYKDMDQNRTGFLISMIDYADVENTKVPVYNHNVQSSLMDIKEILHKNDVDYNVIHEMDLYPADHYIEANARKAILSTATEDEAIEGLEPDLKDLERPYKIALIVRKYDIRAAKCPNPQAIDRNTFTNSETVGTGIHVGCSVNSGLIAQIKDKTHVVYGDKLESTFASEYEIKRLNDFYKGEYSNEANQTDNVQTNF